MIRLIVPGVLGAAIAMSAPQIVSAAYVNVDAGWGVGLGFTSDRPDGIDVEGSEGTELADIHTFTGKENKTFTSTARFTVTNTLDAPFHNSNFWFDVDFSAFNPGGDWIGLSIDNPGQRASFSSSVEGPEAYDTHSCALPASATDVDGYTYFFDNGLWRRSAG